MKVVTLAMFVLVLAGCTHPPQLATSLDVQKQPDGAMLLKLKVTNLNGGATVPINVEVTGQSETNGRWDKVSSLFHPAAFVLNGKEQREITKLWRIQADAVRTTLIVKEQERGNLLKTEKSEKIFSQAGSASTSPR